MDPTILFETIRLMGLPVGMVILLFWTQYTQWQRRHEISRYLRDRERQRSDRWREQAERLLEATSDLHELTRGVSAKVPKPPRRRDNVDSQRASTQLVSIPGRDGEPIVIVAKAGPPFSPPAGRNRYDLDYGRMPSQGKVRGGVRSPLFVRWDTPGARPPCDEWLRNNLPVPPPVPDFDINKDVRFEAVDGPQHPNDPGGDQWEWVEVSTFGDPEPSFVRGRRIVKLSNIIPPPGPEALISKCQTGTLKASYPVKRPAPSFRPNPRLSNPTLMHSAFPTWGLPPQVEPGAAYRPVEFDPLTRLLVWLLGF